MIHSSISMNSLIQCWSSTCLSVYAQPDFSIMVSSLPVYANTSCSRAQLYSIVMIPLNAFFYINECIQFNECSGYSTEKTLMFLKPSVSSLNHHRFNHDQLSSNTITFCHRFGRRFGVRLWYFHSFFRYTAHNYLT